MAKNRGNRYGIINARFWVWHKESYVKLTLRPGEALSKFWKCNTDEGYDFGEEMWEHQGDRVVCCWWSVGKDCDGRQECEIILACPLEELSATQVYRYAGVVYGMPFDEPVAYEGLFKPAWDLVGERRRDHSAEAMNY